MRRLTFAVAALGVLLLAVLVLAPRIVKLDGVRERIVTVGGRLGGEVRIGELRLSLLPSPHVTLARISLALPDAMSIEARAAAVHPRLLPLLRGEVRLASIRLSGVEVALAAESERGEESSSRAPAGPALLAAVRAFVASQGPEITLVADGTLTMATAAPHALWVERADGVRLRIDAEENGEEMLVEIDADVRSLGLRRGGERLDVAGARLRGALRTRGEAVAAEFRRSVSTIPPSRCRAGSTSIRAPAVPRSTSKAPTSASAPFSPPPSFSAREQNPCATSRACCAPARCPGYR